MACISPRTPSSTFESHSTKPARSSRRKSNILTDRSMNLPNPTKTPASAAARKSLATHPRALEIQQHLQSFPWDVTCLNLLTHRHEIFPDVLHGKTTITRIVEYLVELRFLAKAMTGWFEVCAGRSQHYLGQADRRFVLGSIANAYGELEEVLQELVEIRERTYSSAVKAYCNDVGKSLFEIHSSEEIRRILE